LKLKYKNFPGFQYIQNQKRNASEIQGGAFYQLAKVNPVFFITPIGL
jgi:hypothetical protein